MKLQSVNIKNFRCFEDITIDFHERLTVLVGGNGCGKTAVLDVVNRFLETVKDNGFSVQTYKEDNTLNANGRQRLECTLLDNKQYILQSDLSSIDTDKIEGLFGSPFICYYRGMHQQPLRGRQGIYIYASTAALTYKDSLKWFSDKEADEAKHAIKIRDVEYRFADLQAVRMAVSQVLGEYDFPFTAKVPVDMFICKKGKPEIEYSVSQLSDGYRHMLAFVIHLASQMSTANAEQYNKQGKSVLESPAIVLIDEVDLHLHPSWQQRVLPDLLRTFPNTQFIVTTHSPQVISSVEPKHVRVLQGGRVVPVETSIYGAESSRVLEDVFGVNRRPPNEVQDVTEQYIQLINSGEGLSSKAQELRDKLDDWLFDDPILDRFDMFIARKERRTTRQAEGCLGQKERAHA